ncbi:MAG: iron-containing redox enzyme family protein [Polyangiaceae bacterium]
MCATSLGALSALEGVAEHIAGDARQALGKLGLEPRQARFVLVHLQADAAHGAQFLALSRRHAARDPGAMLAAANAAADRWIEMHARALSTT